MTLPRRRHSHRSANRTSYSSHLLSGRHLRRRNTSNTRSGGGSSYYFAAYCSPALLDAMLQTGALCLLSGVAIGIVLLVGKSLSLLQSYLHPDVAPQFDAVAVPRRPLVFGGGTSWLLRGAGGGTNYLFESQQQQQEPSPVWGMNLDVDSLLLGQHGGDAFRRTIDSVADNARYENERAALLRRQDGAGAELTQDEAERYAPTDQLDQPRKCQRTAWRSKFYPVCNLFHELTMDRDNKDRFYDAVFQHSQVFQRTAIADRWEWSLTPQFVRMQAAVPSMTLSQLSLRDVDENDPRAYRQRQVQAIVSERFTSSPRVVTSYGYCGLDALLEQTTGAGRLLSQQEGPLSGREALDVAIRVAESVADLHGFAGGVIVHGQLDLASFRIVDHSSPEQGRGVVLTDLSTADFLDWDPDQQTYCSAVAPANSVETDPALEADFLEVPKLNEQTDTHAVADVMFSLLTGREVGRSMVGIPNIEALVRERGVLEGRLSDVMVKTWTDEITTIFDVLKELREVKREV